MNADVGIPPARRPVGTGCWEVADFPDASAYTEDLTRHEIEELSAFVARMLEDGRQLEAISAREFDCVRLKRRLHDLFELLQKGRGFAVLGGLPVADWSLREAELATWGIGTCLGRGISQSVMGDKLGHVLDATREDPHARAYRNRGPLNPHTDIADVVGMLCLRPAMRGGVSLFTNALAVHNDLLARRPDVLERLYEGFYYHQHGEQAPGEPEISPQKIPVYSASNGQVSVTWNKLYMEMGQIVWNQGPLDEQQRDTFRVFLSAANSDRFQLRFKLEAGQMVLWNNLTHVHARTGFEDFEAPDQRRHLLRLWLRNDALRSKAPIICDYEGSAANGIEVQQGRTPSFDNMAVYAKFGTRPYDWREEEDL